MSIGQPRRNLVRFGIGKRLQRDVCASALERMIPRAEWRGDGTAGRKSRHRQQSLGVLTESHRCRD